MLELKTRQKLFALHGLTLARTARRPSSIRAGFHLVGPLTLPLVLGVEFFGTVLDIYCESVWFLKF